MPAVLATLAAPVALYLIARATLAALSSPATIAVASLPPADYSTVLRSLVRVAPHPNFRISSEMLDVARKGAIASPLAYEPFFIAAKAQEQAKQWGTATQLLEEARLRRPSHVPTRMQLLIYYARARRYPEALAEMDVALRLSEDARRVLLPELTKLIAEPAGRAALASVLAGEPAWRSDFLEIAGARNLKPQHAEALLTLVGARKRRGNVDLERQLFLKSLLGAGEYGRARSIWLGLLRPAERAHNALVFDGAFSGTAAPAGFRWTLNDLDVGRAEIVGSGGQSHLDATYFGGRNVVLAEQVLALAPGNYQLALRAKSAEEIKSGKLYWQIVCLPEGNDIVTVRLERLTGEFAQLGGKFTVPGSGCAGQNLRLVGEAGDVASVINVQTAALEITQ